MQKRTVNYNSYLEIGHLWSDQRPLDCFKSVHLMIAKIRRKGNTYTIYYRYIIVDYYNLGNCETRDARPQS